jgi:hypothetical protein
MLISPIRPTAASVDGCTYSAVLGVSYRLNPLVTAGAAAFAEFANPQAASHGGELNLNVAF